MSEPAVEIDAAVLAAARALITHDRRATLGIVGAPAAGKSSATAALVAALGSAAVGVPMDGFHLSQRVLDTLGRADRKGAPDTFDATGYRDLLQRARTAYGRNETVYAPDFHRDIEEPIAAEIAITPGTPLVITEGNYLLLDEAPWPEIAAGLDTIWAIDIDDAQREQWLLERHQRFGRSEATARAWIADTDRPNAVRIGRNLARADRRLVWHGPVLSFA